MQTKTRIKELREMAGMNRKDFCKYFNIPYRTVTEWELDNRHAPEYVLRLLEYYIRHENFCKESEEYDNSNIIMYTTEDGLIKIEVTFKEDTVGLSL